MDLLLFVLQIVAAFLASWDNFSPVSPPLARSTKFFFLSLQQTGLLSPPSLVWIFWSSVCFWRFPPKALSSLWWYVGFLQFCSPAGSSPPYPELSVELITSQSLCFLSHKWHQIPVPLWWSSTTEMLRPWRLKTTELPVAVVFCLKYVKLLSVLPPLPPHLTESAVLSLLPSLLSLSLNPTLSLHPPGLSAPLPFSNISSQHMHSTSHIQGMLHLP